MNNRAPLISLLPFLFCQIAAAEDVQITTSADGTQTATHQGRSFKLAFESSMKRFEAENAKDLRTGGVVFTGSSTFVRWESLAEDLAPLPVVNRAFGGSTSPQLWHYAERAVLPNKPKIIVTYIGDNDLVQPTVTVENYLKYVRLFVGRVRAQLPETRFVFVSSKPSVARWKLWDKYLAANKALREFCEGDPKLEYVDTTSTLLDANGVVRQDCYGEKDKLHFKPEVYADWARVIKPVVERIWGEVGRGA
jgi:lysophospholipase L1-like esterase